MRDAQATRRRLLDAAAAEFAAHGIAGARVDRVAAAARVNKAQMYAYNGSKDGLFDAVLSEQLAAIVDSVPLDAEDLPGYAIALYDEYLARPELIRLATWARLERTPTGDLLSQFVGHDTSKLESIAAAQASGHIDPALDPRDVYALVTAVSMTWSPASVLVAASREDGAAEHDRRRALLAEIVGRMFRPA
jgi:AcrR family transcriptional regulator